MDDPTATTLDDAADLLLNQDWTHGAPARDEHSHAVPLRSPEARKFCVTGAIYLVAPDEIAARYAVAWLRNFVEGVGIEGLAYWNDRQPTKWPVIYALRQAANAYRERTKQQP